MVMMNAKLSKVGSQWHLTMVCGQWPQQPRTVVFKTRKAVVAHADAFGYDVEVSS